METSILQHLIELTEKIETAATFERLQNIDTLAAEIQKDCNGVALRILSDIVEQLNLAIRKDKAGRKEAGLHMQEKNRTRTMRTILGEFTFSRDYYRSDAGYVYPLDSFLGIDPRERIGREVQARLVSHAAQMSYAKSAKEVTGGEVSRQTVHNLVRKMPVLEISAPKDKLQTKALHIYADEAHVHMQKPGKQRGKQSRIVPLVTVTEGTRKAGQRRNETVHAVHFVDEQMDAKRLWASVEGYIQSAYDAEKLERICIHGDGGQWIKSGLDGYPQAVHVLDQWHFEKALKALNAKFAGRNVRRRIYDAVRKDDRLKADKILQSLLDISQSQSQTEAVHACGTYLMNNWEAIVNRLKGVYPGSCTEGMVSHVLAERFSRDPQGWSAENLGKLTKLRIYTLNGGEVSGEDMRGRSREAKNCYADRLEELLKQRLRRPDFSMFEPEPLVFDGGSGTQQAIRQIGLCRPLS